MNTELLTTVAVWLEARAPREKARGMKFDMKTFIVLEEVPVDDNWCGTA